MVQRIDPCPFCEEDRKFGPVSFCSGTTAVECGECGARGPDEKTWAEAVSSWNDAPRRHEWCTCGQETRERFEKMNSRLGGAQ